MCIPIFPSATGSLPSSSPVREGHRTRVAGLVAPVRRSSRLRAGRGGSERDVATHLEERQGAPGGLPDMDDEARAVAPSERHARPGGRRDIPAVVLDAHAQRRADAPMRFAEPAKSAQR